VPVRVLAPGEPTPAVFDAVLPRLRDDARQLFGADVRLQPVAYELRPFSHLLRLAVWQDGHTVPSSHCFLKIFKPKPVPDGEAQMRTRVEHDYATNRRIHDGLARFPAFGAVRPLICYPDALTIVTEEATGETLLAHLERHAAWFPSPSVVAQLGATMAAAGQWVRAFQTIEPEGEPIAVADLRAYIDVRLQRLAAAGSPVITPASRGAVLAHIDALSAALAPTDCRSVVIHADLAPGNMLVSGDRIVVLDFAMTSRGTRLHDLTRLYLQTDLLGAKPQFRRQVLDAALLALLDGYEPGLTTGDPLFRLLSLLHRVNHLGTLTLNRARFPASLYNRRLRSIHGRWIARELQRPVPA
jgi:hypothetical protein